METSSGGQPVQPPAPAGPPSKLDLTSKLDHDAWGHIHQSFEYTKDFLWNFLLYFPRMSFALVQSNTFYCSLYFFAEIFVSFWIVNFICQPSLQEGIFGFYSIVFSEITLGKGLIRFILVTASETKNVEVMSSSYCNCGQFFI